MVNLKENLEKGFEIDTFNSIKNLKGDTMYLNESTELIKVKQLLIKRDELIKETILEFNECLDMVYSSDFKDSAEIIFLKRKYKEIFGDWKK